MKKVRDFMRFTATVAGGGILLGTNCTADNFWVDGLTTIRDSALAELISALFTVALGQ